MKRQYFWAEKSSPVSQGKNQRSKKPLKWDQWKAE